jgi:hypothetical protein
VVRRHHVAVVGHISPEELRRSLPTTDAWNGFANRFLFVLARRARILPFGGKLGPRQVAAIGREVGTAIRDARGRGEVPWSEDAKPVWTAFCRDVLERPRGGLVGAVTARPRPQALRIALTYALADRSPAIRPEHVRAGAAVWDYAEASARKIFGTGTGDHVADRLAGIIAGRPEGLSRSEVRSALGSGNFSAQRIDSAIRILVSMGLAETWSEPTAGRPREVIGVPRGRNGPNGREGATPLLDHLDHIDQPTAGPHIERANHPPLGVVLDSQAQPGYPWDQRVTP